jgi:uncharacterized pyridoxamine 5'-phosphate oxidase family protein
MSNEEIFAFMNQNPAFHLATVDGDQPRVRGMLLFRADENGIIFHTSNAKDVYAQIMKNPKVELCFYRDGKQLRVSGTLVHNMDETLREEIFNHPSRGFLRAWKDMGIDGKLQVFSLKNGEAVEWSMATNFDEKVKIQL